MIPGIEEDLIAISSSADSTLRAVAGVPPPAVVLRVIDKTAVYQVAEDLGFRVPHTEVIDRDRLLDLPDGGFPLIVKPVRSTRAAKGGTVVRVDAQMIESTARLKRIIARLGAGEWLVQERIGGQLGAICGVAQGGRVRPEPAQGLHHHVEHQWHPSRPDHCNGAVENEHNGAGRQA